MEKLTYFFAATSLWIVLGSIAVYADVTVAGDVNPVAPVSDPVARGQKISSQCAPCHGKQGVSSSPLNPNLAGQKDQYIVNQLLAFKSRERQHTMMNQLAKRLSEEEMKDLAAFFSSLNK